jgi:hypothetical protein
MPDDARATFGPPDDVRRMPRTGRIRLADDGVLHEAVAPAARSSAFPDLGWRPDTLAAGRRESRARGDQGMESVW